MQAYCHAANSEGCCSTQLIDGDGTFNDSGLESFIKEVKLRECGLSYAVVSIMGPQSSGTHPYFPKFLLFVTVNSSSQVSMHDYYISKDYAKV